MKNFRTILFSILFLIVSFCEIYGVLIHSELLEFIFKPLITVSLAVLYLVSVKKPSFLYISALFFSFWGDVLLLFPERFFVLGLVSFLLTHVLYIKLINGFLPKLNVAVFVKFALVFLGYFGGVVFLIKDNLKELLIPVIVYGLVISAFGTFSLVNYIKNKATENLWLLIGAIVFILSDSIIAINKFYLMNTDLGSLIMITYIVAQYLICKALIAKSLKSEL
ncbi:lysoplasmalogenase [Tenacibaculum sp. MEBiC06402]|uniref:lysoplasmalogenase n=1 Tax=unclassified Tenacibaculum TaxID=2635139 RepID=UPI003B9C163C